MSRITFITGGARSGKSRLAEKIACGYGSPLGYVATGCAGDPEMSERIVRHRERRGLQWNTIEEPHAIVDVLKGHDDSFSAILIDCITLWLTNLLLKHEDPAVVLAEVKKLTGMFPHLATPLIIVSNEVGFGIVPENRLARIFRDLAGEANEIIASAADDVYVMFSGLPLKLK